LVPRANELELDPALDNEQVDLLVAGVIGSTIGEHVIGEINFSRFVRERYVDLQSKCTDLVTALQAYRQTERKTLD
jgi:hypothetical protein